MTVLFLNSLGTGEVVLILFVVLMLFGSKGIPDVVKNLGRGMNQIKSASNEIKRDIQKSALEMRKDLKLDDTVQDLSKLAEKSFEEQEEQPRMKPPRSLEDEKSQEQKDQSA